jgi:hypothetical protein
MHTMRMIAEIFFFGCPFLCVLYKQTRCLSGLEVLLHDRALVSPAFLRLLPILEAFFVVHDSVATDDRSNQIQNVSVYLFIFFLLKFHGIERIWSLNIFGGFFFSQDLTSNAPITSNVRSHATILNCFSILKI